MSEDWNPELEQFRKQWKEEVTARVKGSSSQPVDQRPPGHRRRSSQAEHAPKAVAPADDDEYEDEEYDFDDLHSSGEVGRPDAAGESPASVSKQKREPESALEHYEAAVEKETQGSLGDSLNHYRKAYRLDARVDQTYKNKYFPPSVATPKPSNATATVPSPAYPSVAGSLAAATSQLIVSFASESVQGAEPEIDGTPAPPCPIAAVPAEVLAEILLRTAEADVASFARLSRVCRRLAYLVATEEAIWRAICHDPANGFPAMHRQFACAIDGSPLLGADDDEEENTPTSTAAGPTPCLETTLRTLTTTLSALTLTPLYPTYQQMFRTRPRIRFHGAYISTVNYLRPGASSTNQVTWNSPVHIVTYYRYLRFHRDGTAISLLTTSPPLDVIPHLHAANLGTTATGTPAAVMRHALRGRWKLGGGTGADGGRGPEPPPPLPQPESEPEDRLTVETEGPGPKYAYRMQLALRAGGSRAGRVGGAKLAWVGFWSYNRLTDDWAAFGLKNDRAFVWSRVRSWA